MKTTTEHRMTGTRNCHRVSHLPPLYVSYMSTYVHNVHTAVGTDFVISNSHPLPCTLYNDHSHSCSRIRRVHSHFYGIPMGNGRRELTFLEHITGICTCRHLMLFQWHRVFRHNSGLTGLPLHGIYFSDFFSIKQQHCSWWPGITFQTETKWRAST